MRRRSASIEHNENIVDAYLADRNGESVNRLKAIGKPQSAKSAKQIDLQELWNPAMNSVWNEIYPFVYGKELRDNSGKCKYDELFLQGGRACVDGDTLISTPDGDVKICDFAGGTVYAFDRNGGIVEAQGCAATRYSPEKMYSVSVSSGRTVSVTAEHRFLTERGWVACCELSRGDRLLELNCSFGTRPSAFLRGTTVSLALRESYYGGHLSVSHEDALRFCRTLLGLIYRCSRDSRLCDEQLLQEADTFRDVLLLLADAQTHIRGCSHSDGLDDANIHSRSSRYARPLSTSDSPLHTSDICCEDAEIRIYERLYELLSEICPSSRQFHTNEDLACKVQEAARLVLDSTRSPCSRNESQEGEILSALHGMLGRSVADESYSDSFVNDDGVILNRREYITSSEVVSIECIGEREFYDIFVPFYNNYIGNGIVHHNSGKSYFASVIIWLALENDERKNAVIIRKVGSSLRRSCWKQMMKVRNRLELFHWKPNKTDMTFTNENTGQQIFFIGLDDEEKARSTAVEKGYISIAWFEEAKQFSSMEEIDQAVSSLLRGGAEEGSGDSCDEDEEGDMEYMTILTYNPPKSSFDWINREAAIRKPNRLTHKSTYLTMPKKWLGSKVLNEIRIMQQTKPVQYRHMYLGMVTGTGGEYFQNITIRKITDEEIASFEYFNMGIDWGFSDPNVFLKTYIRDRRMYIFDEIYQKELPEDGSNKYEAFARMVLEHTKDCRNDTIYCDAQGKAEAEILGGSKFNIPIAFAPKQGVNGRKAGYKYMQSLLEIIIDPERCPNCAKEFPAFESKAAPNNMGWLDEPGTFGDHTPDCARYSEWLNIQNSEYNEDEGGDLQSVFDDEDSDYDDGIDSDDDDMV